MASTPQEHTEYLAQRAKRERDEYYALCARRNVQQAALQHTEQRIKECPYRVRVVGGVS